MDDLTDKISGLLNDPESLSRIREMAQSLLGGEEEPQNEKNNDNGLSLPENIDMGKLLSVLSRINSREADDRTRLLQALRPHLSEKRQSRVDNAIKILKLIDLLPLLGDSGLFL